MENQIDGSLKEKRSKILIELSNKNEEAYQKEYIGRKVKVLFEEKKNGEYVGHTANYIMVKVKSKKDITNKILDIKIMGISGLEMIGEIIDK